MNPTTSSRWHALPTEMKLAIVENLDFDDVKAFSKVDQRTYQICVPATFKVRATLSSKTELMVECL
jgi:hypothetical protein